MKKLFISIAFGILLSAPALAENNTTMDQVVKELAALSERVSRLEQDNNELRAENSALRASNDRIQVTTKSLQESAATTVEQRVQDDARLAEAESASRFSWKADLRYRYEGIDREEAITDRTRHRVRARLAMSAKINDTLTGTIGLATNGGTDDPRSTNQTLGEDSSRKGIGVNLAYVDWKPVDGFTMTFGKMPQPQFKPADFFFDGDITPEGIAARYASGPFFASAFGYSLSERSKASDASLVGGQFGFTGNVGEVKLTGALGYYDVGSVQGQITTNSGGSCAANLAFFGGPQGNTTVLNDAGCETLVNDYNMIEAVALAEFNLVGKPVKIYAEYIQNTQADDLDTGYLAGFSFGKASDPNSWEFGYAYAMIEKDAQFGQFMDSDFGGGVTDTEGSVFRIGYAPAKRWVLRGTYLMNNRFIDAPGATERDYDRYQIDMNFKF